MTRRATSAPCPDPTHPHISTQAHISTQKQTQTQTLTPTPQGANPQ